MRLAFSILLIGMTTDLLAQEFDPILEEDRRRELEARTNTLGTFTEGSAAPDPGPAQERFGPCFQIDELTVIGADLLTPDEIAAITGRYVPRCMQGADIQAVMRELDGLYADRGFITSKTYIPPQNLQSGSLTLEMLEGRVENVLMVDANEQVGTPHGERQLQTAFPDARGELFQLRDFEQGLDQMNRLQSVDATLRLVPGNDVGGSIVVVQRLQEDPLRGYVRLDNQGSETTGKNRLSFDLEYDDLFGANDAWSLGYAGTQNTNALSLNGSVPYGYWTFRGELSYSEYLTQLSDVSEIFGTSRSISIDANVVTSRDQTTKTDWSFGLDVRRSERDINGVPLTPQKLTTVSGGFRHLQLGENARNSFDGTLSLGMPLFNADRDDPDDADDVPNAQFFKISGGWQRQAGIEGVGTWVSDLRGQWSPHVLYSFEQISLGSGSTVRGYTQAEASGDQGIYWRNDLYFGSDVWSFLPADAANHMAANAQLYGFFDIGATRDLARDVTERAAGFGLGMAYYNGPVTFTAVIGTPLVEDNDWGLGDPVVELRLDVKVF